MNADHGRGALGRDHDQCALWAPEVKLEPVFLEKTEVWEVVAGVVTGVLGVTVALGEFAGGAREKDSRLGGGAPARWWWWRAGAWGQTWARYDWGT